MTRYFTCIPEVYPGPGGIRLKKFLPDGLNGSNCSHKRQILCLRNGGDVWFSLRDPPRTLGRKTRGSGVSSTKKSFDFCLLVPGSHVTLSNTKVEYVKVDVSTSRPEILFGTTFVGRHNWIYPMDVTEQSQKDRHVTPRTRGETGGTSSTTTYLPLKLRVETMSDRYTEKKK